MKNRPIRWRLRQQDVDGLSHALKPIRTCREVARILRCSPATVCELEASALRKIMAAYARIEEELLENLDPNPSYD